MEALEAVVAVAEAQAEAAPDKARCIVERP
jgi:hypothetical protein